MAILSDLVKFIKQFDGKTNKSALAILVKDRFSCVLDRSLYYTRDFAIRFSKANTTSFSNTVISLSALQKYDDRPFFVCVVTPSTNLLLLANTSFLSKISHSSQQLRFDNIKGSFNGSDIIRNVDGIANIPKNFEVLFSFHQNFTFEENLERLVAATNNIVPTGKRFDTSIGNRLNNVLNSPNRAIAFGISPDYCDLLNDLNGRTIKYQSEILVAACIENVNLRGRIIEYIIAGKNAEMRNKLVDSIFKRADFPHMITLDGLGDYSKHYPNFYTETDIKTKIMILASAPKGYNIDKILEFLSEDNTVFMIFLVGIDYGSRTIKTKLVSMFQDTLIDNTIIQTHWAGRNSRGVSQFNGNAVKRIILNESNVIDNVKARRLLEKILAL